MPQGHGALRKADERARLRDEVKAAAEREASDIIAAARRDVRRILLQARRDVVTLNLQVQAALGTSPAFSASAGARQLPESEGAAPLTARREHVAGGVATAARRNIRDVLEEARAELDAFAPTVHPPITLPPAVAVSGPPATSPVGVASARRAWTASLVVAAAVFGAAFAVGARLLPDAKPASAAGLPPAANIQQVQPNDRSPSRSQMAAPVSGADAATVVPLAARVNAPQVSRDETNVVRPTQPAPPGRTASESAPPIRRVQPRLAETSETAGTMFSPAPSSVATGEAPVTVATQEAPQPGSAEAWSAAQLEMIVAGEQWLDAYQRRDRNAIAALAAEDATVSDERGPDERFPDGLGVRRALDQVQIHVVGNAGTLTAAMTEEASAPGEQQHVSRVSQTWLRENGKWRLIQARIISDARLRQSAR